VKSLGRKKSRKTYMLEQILVAKTNPSWRNLLCAGFCRDLFEHASEVHLVRKSAAKGPDFVPPCGHGKIS
jgi:hypothetical protein